ncbi:MAG: PaaI family thioesterase [Phycisphaerae bacterium]|nr:PaaI family thioesterase [Phycisphaerae bacterium]
MINPEIERRLREDTKQVPCIQALQLELLSAADGYVEMSAVNNPAWNALRPGVHGGVLAFIADCVAWYAIATRVGPDVPMVTTDLDIRYLGPCLSDHVRCVGRVIKFGRTLNPVTVELSDHEKVAAVAQVCYMRLDATPR